MTLGIRLMLVSLICGTAPASAPAQQADRIALEQLCRGGALEGRVLDTYDAVVAGATIEALVPSNGGESFVMHRAETDVDGRFSLPCPSTPIYRLRISAPGFPAKTLASTDLVENADRLTVYLGIPCEGAVGPNMVLSPEDRSVIVGFLVEQAFANSDDRILSDENLDRHKLGFELPAGVRLLNERTIRQMSKQATVRYIGVSELEVHGTCVEAGYYTSCYHEGEPCGLCCESRTYIFSKVAGRWEHEFYSGAVV